MNLGSTSHLVSFICCPELEQLALFSVDGGPLVDVSHLLMLDSLHISVVDGSRIWPLGNWELDSTMNMTSSSLRNNGTYLFIDFAHGIQEI
jgi:hypothetical protein